MCNELSLDMLRVFRRVIEKYDAAIAHLEEGLNMAGIFERWDGYGPESSCSLCHASSTWGCRPYPPGTDSLTPAQCYDCPLFADLKMRSVPCEEATMTELSDLIVQGGGWLLGDNLLAPNREELIEAFKNRREWLLKRAAENRVVVEKKEGFYRVSQNPCDCS